MEVTLARKKTTAKPGPKAKATGATVKSVAFRVSAAYSKWLEEMAAHNRTTVAGLLDQALARHARETGFREPPARA